MSSMRIIELCCVALFGGAGRKNKHNGCYNWKFGSYSHWGFMGYARASDVLVM